MAVKTQTAAIPQRQRVSLVRDNFTKGGILPEGDYLVKESQFVIFAYADKDGRPTGAQTTAKRMVLQAVTKNDKGQFVEDPAQQPVDQHWSIGDLKNFVPSADGNFLEVVGKSSMSQQCKYFFLFDSLINSGVPEQLYDQEGAALLIGMIGHIKHIDAPDYSSMRNRNASAVGTGIVQQVPEKKKDFKETIPTFSAIMVAPWDKKGGKATPAPAPKAAAPVKTAAPAPEPEAEASEGADNRLAQFIKDAVIGSGNTMSRTKCRLEVHRAYNKAGVDATERTAELEAFNDDGTLTAVLDSVDCILSNGNIEYAG